MAPPQDLLGLVHRCREKNGYIVGIDGVLTGIYKTGKLLGCEGRIAPDIITLFKGLTDATFPIGTTGSGKLFVPVNPKIFM